MNTRMIIAELIMEEVGSTSQVSYTTSIEYDSNRTKESYIEQFFLEVKQNGNYSRIEVIALKLTIHDSDGKFIMDEFGHIKTEAIY